VNVNIVRAVLAGVFGTIVMTAVGLWVAPLMGIPPMNPANMLTEAMGGVIALGWLGHFAIGVILAVIYAVVAPSIPGSPMVSGALYGIAPWLLAQVAVIPMMGMPFFSGSIAMAVGSLIGHLVYGAVVGVVYGEASAPRTRDAGLSAAV
jgi:uncharacterized membrane protein YagU involved in acid resistance